MRVCPTLSMLCHMHSSCLDAWITLICPQASGLNERWCLPHFPLFNWLLPTVGDVGGVWLKHWSDVAQSSCIQHVFSAYLEVTKAWRCAMHVVCIETSCFPPTLTAFVIMPFRICNASNTLLPGRFASDLRTPTSISRRFENVLQHWPVCHSATGTDMTYVANLFSSRFVSPSCRIKVMVLFTWYRLNDSFFATSLCEMLYWHALSTLTGL
jgi:hypothetical protein